MDRNSSQSTVCRACGKPFDVVAPQILNVAQDPTLKERVKDGSLFSFVCPHCGAVNFCWFKTLYHDPSSRLMIWLLPQMSAGEYEGLVQVWNEIKPQDAFEGYTFRRVSEAGALIEKVRIFDSGLEDTVVELCKYVTAMELSQDEKDPVKAAALSAATLRFRNIEGADHEMSFVFPLNGAMQSVKAGFNVYEDCRAIVSRNPDILPAGPFPEINRDWVLSVLR